MDSHKITKYIIYRVTYKQLHNNTPTNQQTNYNQTNNYILKIINCKQLYPGEDKLSIVSYQQLNVI